MTMVVKQDKSPAQLYQELDGMLSQERQRADLLQIRLEELDELSDEFERIPENTEIHLQRVKFNDKWIWYFKMYFSAMPEDTFIGQGETAPVAIRRAVLKWNASK